MPAGESGLGQQGSKGPAPPSTIVEGLSLRLAALVELGLLLPSERESGRLLQLFVRAAQDIMRARYAVVGVDGAQGMHWCFAAHGMTGEEEAAVLASLDPTAGVLGEVLAEVRPERRRDLPADPTVLGLPAGHPPIRSLLAVPVTSSRRPCGWLYVADKRGADEFSDDDVQFAMTLAAQLAPIWESLVLIEEARRQSAALAESEERYRLLWQTTTDAVILMDAKSRIQYANPAVADVFGYLPADLIGQDLSILQAEELRGAHRFGVSRFVESGVKTLDWRGFETVGRHRDGRELPVEVAFSHVVLAGEPVFAGFIRDISERKEQQDRIARLTRLYAVLSGINMAIVRARDRQALFEEACRTAVSEGAFQMAWIGVLDPEARQGQVVAWAGDATGYVERVRFSAEEDAPERDRPASRAVRECSPVVLSDLASEPALTGQRDDLLAKGYRSLAAFPLLVEGRSVGVLVLYSNQVGFFDGEELKLLAELAGDISFGLQYLSKEEELAYRSLYDPVTGLPNATLFYDRLTQSLHGALPGTGILAVILVDLDRFTQINDTLGRHVGDAVLSAVGQAFAAALREPYSLARIGADTFAVAVPHLRQPTYAAAILHKRLFAALEVPFLVQGHEISISARAGIALHPADGEDAECLLKNAEASLKKAQTTGERFVFYEREITARAAQRLTLESKLRRAAAQEQFLFHYQPKLDTQSGRLAGLEALMRWNDPERGLVAPVEFIPMLEETGLILEVGQWGLAKALADTRGWQAEGLRPPPVAVNVSALQLQRPDFLDRLRRVLTASGAAAETLELEITESLIMSDFERGSETLRRIRDMGISIAIDDFGTGYSSLRYLAKLPIDTLKIHRSFIVAMVDDPDSMAIVQTVISLGHALGLGIVGEGVDSEEQAKLLRLMRCDTVQGFLYSKPVGLEAMTGLLRRHLEAGRFERQEN